MRESAESRSAAVRAVLLRFYPHQYAWGESCAVTVSLLLRFTEAAHDRALRNRIYKRTVVCRLRESGARACCACTSLDFHSMDLTIQTYIQFILQWRRARGTTRARRRHRFIHEVPRTPMSNHVPFAWHAKSSTYCLSSTWPGLMPMAFSGDEA